MIFCFFCRWEYSYDFFKIYQNEEMKKLGGFAKKKNNELISLMHSKVFSFLYQSV